MKEYQVFELDPELELCHKSNAEILFDSDDLASAHTYAYRMYLLRKMETAIWQPRTNAYRGYYKKDESI